MSYQKSEYFIKAVRFIYDNIDQPITLEDIAKAIGVSVSSLKRLFTEATNKSPGAFIRRLRMELAFRSLQNRNDTVLEVALNSGFDDQSAFARCFKDTFGYSPKESRKKINIVNEFESISLGDPDIIELVDLPIQSVTEQGIYFESAKRAWDGLKKKLSTDELGDNFSGIFIGMGHDNPHEGEVAEDKVRFSAGVTHVERNIEVEHRIISGGRYARFHYIGKPVNLGLAYHYIYGKWSETSALKINKHIPAFVTYDTFPEAFKEYLILIHVPIIP